MSDIVERLNGGLIFDEKGRSVDVWRTNFLMNEAADTIARLRSRIAELEGALTKHACSCPGECERKTDNYADRDSLCEAHDVISCHTAACKDSEQSASSPTPPGIVPSK